MFRRSPSVLLDIAFAIRVIEIRVPQRRIDCAIHSMS